MTIEDIRSRWNGIDWAYIEDREGEYLANIHLQTPDLVLLDLEEPNKTEQTTLRLAAHAPGDIRTLLMMLDAALQNAEHWRIQAQDTLLELHQRETDLAATYKALHELWNEWAEGPDSQALLQAETVLDNTQSQVFNKIKSQLLLMRRYIIRHGGMMGGECVAWQELKEYFGVGLNDAEDEKWMQTYSGRPFTLR